MDYTAIATALVSSAMWKILLIIIVGLIIANIVKYVSTVIFDYIMLKSDLIGIGTIVEYENKRYIIRDISFRRLTLESKDQNKNKHEKIYVLIDEWRKMHIVYTFEG